jgi:hypothetical protein
MRARKIPIHKDSPIAEAINIAAAGTRRPLLPRFSTMVFLLNSIEVAVSMVPISSLQKIRAELGLYT